MAEPLEAARTAVKAPPVVLLVEDNPADVRMIREALQVSRLAHQLYVVDDGEQALDFLARRGAYADAPEPDLMLLDLNIPRINGHEVLERLRAERRAMRLPIVVMTGSPLVKDIDRSLALNAEQHMIKPTRLHEYVGGLAFALGLVRKRAS